LKIYQRGYRGCGWQLSSRYIHDRKLPDKAIDVIDESGAAQMLVAEEQAQKKTIGIKEIETTIATMARIFRPRASQRTTPEVFENTSKQTLKRVVFGQGKRRSRRFQLRSSWRRAGLREPEKADRPRICFRPDRRRQGPRLQKQARRPRWASN